ncbi:hypothetical protein RB620_13345 [Paenibacillus sp. LHD-117]|uniref:hypothetical protein n=1 Tax=Paenibacillus sp. LHD-117 TaxID=3071412 RepID=UPI0027E21556|nr:hypothetical protein [Paenibacillus sp. LHD-117]MDQ6420423.1 hypothetical protein [Paenibacillus sp. LHD-117]
MKKIDWFAQRIAALVGALVGVQNVFHKMVTKSLGARTLSLNRRRLEDSNLVQEIFDHIVFKAIELRMVAGRVLPKCSETYNILMW